MFSKKPSRANDAVPRRRRIAGDEFEAGANAPRASAGGDERGSYRRNQTLSSYRSSTPEESSRHKAHNLTMQRRKLSGIFAIVTVAVILLALLLWQLIAQVHVTTSTKQLSGPFDTSLYERAVNDYLNLNPAHRLRFALDEGALSEFVSAEHPEVESITPSGSAGLAQTNFAVTFRTPVAGWQINGNQYYVDANGVVFEKNYYSAPAVQIVDESGVRPEQGSAVVGTRLLGFLGRVVAQAEGRGYTAVKATLPEGTTRQVELEFKDVAPRVKFSIDRGAGEQMEDADRALKFLKEQGIGAGYIDVRVSGRAAYQ